MDTEFENLLYRRPELYESAVVYGAGHESARMCELIFDRHFGRPPTSLLDIGCGTGRDLAYLAEFCPDCIGIDYQKSMVDFARENRAGIDFRVGDMRSARLARTFEAIICLGYAIANVHSNAGIARSFETFAAHAEPGTLLIIDAISALGEPGGGSLARRFVVDSPEFKAEAEALYSEDRRHQLLIRQREWVVANGDPVQDFVKLRKLAPMELQHYLELHGFEILGVYDNRELLETDLSGTLLFAFARFVG